MEGIIKKRKLAKYFDILFLYFENFKDFVLAHFPSIKTNITSIQWKAFTKDLNK